MQDEPELRVTSMITPLHDKLSRQKNSLKRLLSKPKRERNTRVIKMILKEAKRIQKILKKYHKQGLQVKCPNCNHIHTVLTE